MDDLDSSTTVQFFCHPISIQDAVHTVYCIILEHILKLSFKHCFKKLREAHHMDRFGYSASAHLMRMLP
uniref:Uncharacterized protein n=1 Tax=Ciona savignyi TaxID=51511 RepID=H2YK42_CIOSA